jgi:hypothetical protein
MDDNETKTFSNIAAIRDAINTGDHNMSLEEAHRIVDGEKARLERIERERHLDPLHVQTPMLQRMQRELPNLNSQAGSTNWILLATFANLIVELRTKGVSTPDIEESIREAPFKMLRAVYKANLVKRG